MLRIAVTSALVVLVAAAVLVTGLMIWTEWHLPLRKLGPDTFVFLSVFVVLGVPSFGAVSWLLPRVLPRTTKLPEYFAVTGLLWAALIATAVRIVSEPTSFHLEGGDISLRVWLFTCVLGVIVAALTQYIRSRNA